MVNEDGDDDAVNDDCETILYPQENETGLEGRGGVKRRAERLDRVRGI